MTLGRLLDLVPPSRLVVDSPWSWRDLPLEQLAFDSRQAGPSALFFALEGIHTDGHQYLNDVAQRGGRAAVVSRVPPVPLKNTVYAVVDSPREYLSRCAAAFYDHPSRQLITLGVTGTDGKSSTVSFIQQLLAMSHARTGFFSTVEWSDGGEVRHNEGRQSTPEAPQVHEVLRTMINAGCRFGVIEATSHGLSPKTSRLADVVWAGAVFTNVTTEHLEFHGTVEQYRRDKARLFEALRRGRPDSFGVVNRDDPWADLYLDAAKPQPVSVYSLTDPRADLWVSSIIEEADGLRLTLTASGRSAREVRLPIPGRFNASNAAAALLAASHALSLSGEQVDALDLVPLLERLRPVKGRMVSVREGQPFAVLVDYAHTPGAFEALLPAVRAVTKGRLIVVFGSGGERDRQKRPLQGDLADRWADLIILTDEDPRLEGSLPILDDIAAGIRNKVEGQSFWKIPPRREALRRALALAQPGDTVLLLGKGHERSIVGSGGPEPWDEESEARAALRELASGGRQ